MRSASSAQPYFFQQQRFKDANAKSKSKFSVSKSLVEEEDVPPPLPQRNPTRTPTPATTDLDHNASFTTTAATATELASPATNANANAKPSKRSATKCKTKAHSDPKVSTQMFLQMESTPSSLAARGPNGDNVDSCTPPPLPPRQPGMLSEETFRGSCQNLNGVNGAARAAPNSINTLFSYPLVSTCTAVQSGGGGGGGADNMAAAFPLSHRPNIVQQLQQHQQQQQQQQQTSGLLGPSPHNPAQLKHRRVVSSPDNVHARQAERSAKASSGSWDLTERECENTPPGTPPPPYMCSNMSLAEHAHAHEHTPNFALLPNATSTPPTATPSNSSSTANNSRAQLNDSQREIISMEDETTSDQEGPYIDENGPFNNFSRLLETENVVFLAVFLNYVLSNSEPTPLLFYLITELYKEGSVKDMRKWAYEIHSTFLVPRAPLSWCPHDESLVRDIDNVLQNEFDKGAMLQKLFFHWRKRAKDIITEQLREFQQKRTAGLGTIYGPTDAQLAEARSDKQREHIVEETLIRKLQILIEEHERDLPAEDPRKLAMCSALSTVIHRIFTTRNQANGIVDRVHHFVSREKSFKSRLMGKNRKMVVRGHPLVLHQYYEVTNCNHCQTIIWGVSPQGYHCTVCKLNIHRPCSKVLDEDCPGPVPQAKRNAHNDNKISKFMGKIRPRNSSDFIAAEKRARHEEELDTAELVNERLNASAIVRQPSDRKQPDANVSSSRSNGGGAGNTSTSSALGASSDLHGSFHGSIGGANDSGVGAAIAAGNTSVDSASGAVGALNADLMHAIDADGRDVRRERYHQHHASASAPVSVNRSESYKERVLNKRYRNSRRKTSDPSLNAPPNDDQQQTDLALTNSNYTASSNSSLSSGGGGGSESPSTSMEQVGAAAATNAAWHAQHPHHQHPLHQHQHQHQHHTQHHGAPPPPPPYTPYSHSHSHNHSHGHGHGHGVHQDSFHGSTASAGLWTAGQSNFESDEEDDGTETVWASLVSQDVLATLSDGVKKRQEIINEIYHTERSHVRVLKLLDGLFYASLFESNLLPTDLCTILSPPAPLREFHGNFELKLRQRRIEHGYVVRHIGDLLSEMFDSQSGEELREHGVQYCGRQQIALEAIKEKRRKDEQLHKLLNKLEAHKACRRLHIQDLMPAVWQRLTKYPMLFENLYKLTVRVMPEETAEAEAIQSALEACKRILVDVNKAVRTAEDAHKLQNIQRKLDKSTIDKDEFKNLDLTQYHLVHDGNLTMKKNPNIQLYGLLFENMIVLLTKQDDKYSLKYLHATPAINNKPVNPIMSIDSEFLVRQEAADKNSFFLIKTKTSQMLELRAPSSSECKTWFKHISDAAEQYKTRSKSNNAISNNHEHADDAANAASVPHSHTRESLELTPDRPAPVAATATVSTTPLAPLHAMPNITPAVSSNQHHHQYHQHQHQHHQQQHHAHHTSSGRRESTPVVAIDNGGYYNLGKKRFSHNELLGPNSSVNRTMSTRSCGDPASSNSNLPGADAVTLRHTQSARSAASAANADSSSGSKRDSASIVYSNNANDTRTLFMQSPLVDPTTIQISISPAHTAEPVLTPGERLRRLDAAIRDGLLEKQQIICDMFRLPVEHYHEIVDIAMMPEAPKDSADIALAAYDQVQSLTKVLNEYMQISTEREISAVSTAVCDHCHEKNQQAQPQQQQQQQPQRPTKTVAAASNIQAANKPASTANTKSDSPPPLPPPNRQQAQGQQRPPSKHVSKAPGKLIGAHLFERNETVNIHEDDDGYCEIDELRLPAVPLPQHKQQPLQAIPIAQFKVPPARPATPPTSSNTTTPLASAVAVAAAVAAVVAPVAATPELIKRQSVISADSIPEESVDELTKALVDEKLQQTSSDEKTAKNEPKPELEPEQKPAEEAMETSQIEDIKEEAKKQEDDSQEKQLDDSNEAKKSEQTEEPEPQVAENAEEKSDEEKPTEEKPVEEEVAETAKSSEEQADAEKTEVAEETAEKSTTSDVTTTTTTTTQSTAEPQHQKSVEVKTDELVLKEAVDDGKDVGDVCATLAALNKAQTKLSMIDNSTQTTQPLILAVTSISASGNKTTTSTTGTKTFASSCGPNRLQHASSLEPSVPCHALSSIVSVLNEQISLLLPKINERDAERERLRKENQHLRELLSAMHSRQRVDSRLPTPINVTINSNSAADDANDDEVDSASVDTLTPTPTPTLTLTPTVTTSSSSSSPIPNAHAAAAPNLNECTSTPASAPTTTTDDSANTTTNEAEI